MHVTKFTKQRRVKCYFEMGFIKSTLFQINADILSKECQGAAYVILYQLNLTFFYVHSTVQDSFVLEPIMNRMCIYTYIHT